MPLEERPTVTLDTPVSGPAPPRHEPRGSREQWKWESCGGGFDELSLCLAVCPSRSMWAVGLGGATKRRQQAAPVVQRAARLPAGHRPHPPVLQPRHRLLPKPPDRRALRPDAATGPWSLHKQNEGFSPAYDVDAERRANNALQNCIQLTMPSGIPLYMPATIRHKEQRRIPTSPTTVTVSLPSSLRRPLVSPNSELCRI